MDTLKGFSEWYKYRKQHKRELVLSWFTLCKMQRWWENGSSSWWYLHGLANWALSLHTYSFSSNFLNFFWKYTVLEADVKQTCVFSYIALMWNPVIYLMTTGPFTFSSAGFSSKCDRNLLSHLLDRRIYSHK